MTVQCITCTRADLRGAEKMARHGFGLCELKPRHEFHPVLVHRECPHHAEAPAPIVAARRAWLEKKGAS